MKRRLGESFLNCYLELDKDCCEKFGVATGGVTEYINRLNSARFAPGRDEALPRLVRYRNIRNKYAHEPDTLRRADEITKSDVAWLRSFDRDLVRRRDPISAYLRRARRYARHRRFKRYLVGTAFVLLIILIIVLYFELRT